MSRHLLTSILFGTALAMSAQSAPVILTPADAFQAPAKVEAQKFNIQFCGNEVGGWACYTPADFKSITGYIHVPAEQASKLAGNKITGLTLSVVTSQSNKDATAKGTVFISEDIDSDPLYSLNMTYRNALYLDGYRQEAQLPRSKQYEIKAGTPFYFGFTVNLTEENDLLGIGFDKLGTNADFSGTLLFTDSEGNTTTCEGKEIPIQQQSGVEEFHNLFLFAMSEGVPLDTDQFSIGAFSLGSWSTPTFDKENIMPMKVEVDNTGATDITSMTYTYWFNDDPTEVPVVAEVSVPAGTKGFAELPIDYPVGRHSVTVRLEKVNDTPISLLGNGSFFYLGDSAYPAKFIVEKLTGTGCGYCPRGIYAFEYMEERYWEDFVGIEIMNYNSGERYYCMSYGPLTKQFSGAPNCMINRTPGYKGNGISYDYLENAYKLWKGQRSNGNIELDVVCDDAINVTSHTTFAVDDNHSYRLAYVICENGLKGTQSNNYAGTGDPIVGDWGSKGGSVSWTYNGVAREVQDALGYYDSTISSPKGGETYDCSLSFDKRCLYNGDLSKAYVCALLIDASTGELITAATKELVAGGDSGAGVNCIGSDCITPAGNAIPAYYTIDGIRVANPQPGSLYIRVCNGKASKVLF